MKCQLDGHRYSDNVYRVQDLGFSNQWINWIWQCISTVDFKVIINIRKGASFALERGIRQGDPLSPYRFIVCTEYLGKYINFMAKSTKTWHWHKGK